MVTIKDIFVVGIMGQSLCQGRVCNGHDSSGWMVYIFTLRVSIPVSSYIQGLIRI